MTSPQSRGFLAAIVGLLLLGVGYGVGYRAGQGWTRAQEEARGARVEGQVRHLLDLAYPKNNPFPLVESVPLGPVMKDVEQHRNAPEVVRAILYDQVSKEQGDFITSQNQIKLPKGHPYWERDFLPSVREYGRRATALKEWTPGDTGSTTPAKEPRR